MEVYQIEDVIFLVNFGFRGLILRTDCGRELWLSRVADFILMLDTMNVGVISEEALLLRVT